MEMGKVRKRDSFGSYQGMLDFFSALAGTRKFNFPAVCSALRTLILILIIFVLQHHSSCVELLVAIFFSSLDLLTSPCWAARVARAELASLLAGDVALPLPRWYWSLEMRMVGHVPSIPG